MQSAPRRYSSRRRSKWRRTPSSRLEHEDDPLLEVPHGMRIEGNRTPVLDGTSADAISDKPGQATGMFPVFPEELDVRRPSVRTLGVLGRRPRLSSRPNHIRPTIQPRALRRNALAMY